MAPLAAHAATSAAGPDAGGWGYGSPGAVTWAMIAADMAVDELSLDDLVGAVRGTSGARPWSDAAVPGVVVVDLDAGPPPDGVPTLHAAVRAVVVGLAAGLPEGDPGAHPAAAICDVMFGPGDPRLDAVVATVGSSPLAACALAVLLRRSTPPSPPSRPSTRRCRPGPSSPPGARRGRAGPGGRRATRWRSSATARW
jgi:hypothetical protein